MESKIEKIEIIVGKEMCIEEEIQNLYENYMELVDKTNQIIDHLNSQAQPEEIDNTKLVMPPSAYEQAEKEGFDMRNKVKSELLPEDTPEEWEKGLEDIVKQWNNGEYVGTLPHTELYDFIDQELDKAREGELEWILKNCSGGGNWRRIVNQRLSKLKDNK